MVRVCPNCSARLSSCLFLVPRFLHQYRCPSCNSAIAFTGAYSWGLGGLGLLLSYAIYRIVDGNFMQAVAVLPIALLIVGLEYRFARLKVVDR